MNEALALGAYADYFNWLIDIVGGEEWWSEYGENLVRLFERSYYYENEIDGNLVSDVEELRIRAMGTRPPMIVPSTEASVLEVLIVLADKIDFILTPSYEESRVPKRFNDFMDCLGFKDDISTIDKQVDRFLDGKNQITRGRNTRPVPTYWQQVNGFYLDEFNMESDL